MQEIEKTDAVDVVSMFFHSFQFIDWRKNPDAPVFSKKKNEYVIRNMNYLKEHDAKYIREEDLFDIPENCFDKLGAVDTSKGIAAYYYFSIHAIKTVLQRVVRNV